MYEVYKKRVSFCKLLEYGNDNDVDIWRISKYEKKLIYVRGIGWERK